MVGPSLSGLNELFVLICIHTGTIAMQCGNFIETGLLFFAVYWHHISPYLLVGHVGAPPPNLTPIYASLRIDFRPPWCIIPAQVHCAVLP